MAIFKITFFAIVLTAIFSGCATNQNFQQNASPTISGYIDVGAQKNLGH
jgi:hypothetical protein